MYKKLLEEILRKTLPERKDVDRHIVYNIRLRDRRRKLELEAANIEVLANHFDASCINDYKSDSDNYSKGMFVFLYYSCCLIMKINYHLGAVTVESSLNHQSYCYLGSFTVS